MFTQETQEELFSASTELRSGNSDLQWMSCEGRQIYNIIYPLKTSPEGIPLILLGYKKRGLHASKWNGFGGKCEEGETNIQAAARELEEESGLKVTTDQLTHIGSMMYVMEGRARSNSIDCFTCTDWKGEPIETEEMRPQWFSYASFLTPGANDGEFIPMTSEMLLDETWLYMKNFLASQHLIIRADFFRKDEMARYFVGETMPGATNFGE